MASRLNPTNFGYQNFYSALLTADITSSTTTISVDTVPTPTSGILVIEPDSTTNREVILYTSKGASTIVCPSDGRGFDSTTAVSHLTGSTIIYAPIKRIFEGLASGELSTDPIRTEAFANGVASGALWTADAAGSTRNASQSSGIIYINGRRLTVAAVVARSFTASKDTYVDASDNGDGTALLLYTEVTNGAASPALAANSIRLAKVVTGASNIAVGGVTAPGHDSLGNIIYPKGLVPTSNLQNPYKFRVYRSAAQNTINGTAKILFDTKTYDTGNNFDVTTNNRFTAPVAGFYNFTSSARVTSSANFQLLLYKNGILTSEGVNNGGSGVNQGSIVIDTIQLAASDYVEVFASCSAASGLFVSASGVYFTGEFKGSS